MRGALPDVECPRCGETWPPTEDARLATCARCGLVFPPHEVLHPSTRDHPPPPEPPPRAGPWADITVERRGDALEVAWRHHPWDSGKLGLAITALGALGMATAEAWPSIGVGAAVALGYLALIVRRARDSARAVAGELDVHVRRFPFGRRRRLREAEIAYVGLETAGAGAHGRSRVQIYLRDGSAFTVAESQTLAVAAYLAERLTEALAATRRPAAPDGGVTG
jgi:hypothetical protein